MAIVALANIGCPCAAPRLIEIATGTEPHILRQQAASALARLGDPRAVRLFESWLDHRRSERRWARKQIARATAQHSRTRLDTARSTVSEFEPGDPEHSTAVSPDAPMSSYLDVRVAGQGHDYAVHRSFLNGAGSATLVAGCGVSRSGLLIVTDRGLTFAKLSLSDRGQSVRTIAYKDIRRAESGHLGDSFGIVRLLTSRGRLTFRFVESEAAAADVSHSISSRISDEAIEVHMPLRARLGGLIRALGGWLYRFLYR